MSALTRDDVRKSAYISECNAYRYWLKREWGGGGNLLAFVMLNPSTADAELDDPTIRRCIGFAKREGRGGIVVVNLFAGRATQPADLFKMPEPVGPNNYYQWMSWLRHEATKVVCAWGAEPAAAKQAKDFRRFAGEEGVELWCLGKTKDGHPRHPLYLKSDAPLERYDT
jgi:hypothetical protein